MSLLIQGGSLNHADSWNKAVGFGCCGIRSRNPLGVSARGRILSRNGISCTWCLQPGKESSVGSGFGWIGKVGSGLYVHHPDLGDSGARGTDGGGEGDNMIPIDVGEKDNVNGGDLKKTECVAAWVTSGPCNGHVIKI